MKGLIAAEETGVSSFACPSAHHLQHGQAKHLGKSDCRKAGHACSDWLQACLQGLGLASTAACTCEQMQGLHFHTASVLARVMEVTLAMAADEAQANGATALQLVPGEWTVQMGMQETRCPVSAVTPPGSQPAPMTMMRQVGQAIEKTVTHFVTQS